MPVDFLFRIANTAALLAWVALIVSPRRDLLRRWLLPAVVGAFCLLYATLVFVFFFRVEGGGFGSLAAVQRLFVSPPVALAGWVHYLAFDLCAGFWIAARSDAMGFSRWLQAPLLVTTFMFGPIGLLLFGAVLLAGGGRWQAAEPAP